MSYTERNHGHRVPSGIERALVVAAHPDDIECFAGGAVALLTRAGADVSYFFATRGEAGSDDPALGREDVIALRDREQTEAARLLGVKNLLWHDEPDGDVHDRTALRHAIVRAVRTVRPDVVITFDPTRYLLGTYVNHADHRAVGAAAMTATWPSAANARYAPQHLSAALTPHVVRELWLMMATEPDFALDIESVLPDKSAALSAHASQGQHPDAVTARLLADATRDGVPGARLAERYRRVVINAPESAL
ncbi:PIG-L deacetylase family protein [Streptomyces sp. WAC 04229]|uniref:PIG-L deacetylase family protein n=1 Tax=Streptomyces sp. WAC 04229 TaxID=2203206 RepID=UPI003D75446F